MIITSKMLQELLAAKELLGEVTRVAFKYVPDFEKISMSSLPDFIDELFKKAGYTEVRSMVEVRRYLEDLADQRRLAETAKVLPTSESTKEATPIDPRDKLLSIGDVEDELEPPKSTDENKEESHGNGIPPFVNLIAALLGGAILLNEGIGGEENEEGEGNFPVSEKELAVLKSCNSEDDWNKACEAIKAARSGYYPEDWHERVILSGLQEEIQARWRK